MLPGTAGGNSSTLVRACLDKHQTSKSNAQRTTHTTAPATLLFTQLHMAPTIAAVKFACNGEAKKGFQIAPYTVYNLQEEHDIFKTGEVSEVSRLIGMELVMTPLRPSLLAVFRPREAKHRYVQGDDRKTAKIRRDFPVQEPEMDWTAYANYGYKDGADYFPNDTAAMLMVSCSPNREAALLHPPAKWIHKVGSVLIARQDKVALHPMHVEILKGFITAVHESFTEKGKTDYLTAEIIAETVTPQMWQAYWHKATDHMRSTGQGSQLEGVPVPFDEHAAASDDRDEGGVQVGDSDMMDYSDVGFVQ